MLCVCVAPYGIDHHPSLLCPRREREGSAQREPPDGRPSGRAFRGEGQPRTLGGSGLGRFFFTSFVLGFALVAAGVRPAGAQQTTVLPGAAAEPTQLPGGMQILAVPYLWLGGIHETVTTPIPRASTVNIDVDPLQVLGDLNAVPFMGSLEIRDGPFGLFGDALHIPLGTGVKTHNIAFNGGSAQIIQNTGTALLLYRFVDVPTQYADLGVGFRAWGFTTNVNLNPGQLPRVTSNEMATWGDPLIGGRYHIDFPSGFLPSGFGFSAYGDVGGFGVSAHSDWQLVGTIDYTPSPWIDFHLGYRSLNFDYTTKVAIGFNVHLRGPILAATIKF
jgi:hypothetical protein